MRLTILATTLAIFLGGCASAGGAGGMTGDFNKYHENYRPFPTDGIQIGQGKEALVAALGSHYTVAEAGEGYEVLAFQKWASVAGPDYVEQTLYVRLARGVVDKWKITNDTTSIVPRSW